MPNNTLSTLQSWQRAPGSKWRGGLVAVLIAGNRIDQAVNLVGRSV